MRVGLFVTCLVDLMRPRIGFAALRLLQQAGCEVVVPEANMINYKEAMIFALLGAMRVHNQCNTLSSATGASVDWVAGSLDGDFGHLITN